MSKQTEPEKKFLDRIRLEASKLGARLFRNDNGMGRRLKTEEVFSYGLGKGTSDLIGWTPVVITQAMVGKTVAVFTAIEGKRGSDRLSLEQMDFILAVWRSHGIAFVLDGSKDTYTQINENLIAFSGQAPDS